jgi:hypothetical protein
MKLFTFCEICNELFEVDGTNGFFHHVMEEHPHSRLAAQIEWELGSLARYEAANQAVTTP